MPFILQPWQFFFAILAGWVNREQQEVIDYLRTGNAVLKEPHGPGRILLNDDQWRRLTLRASGRPHRCIEADLACALGARAVGRPTRTDLSEFAPVCAAGARSEPVRNALGESVRGTLEHRTTADGTWQFVVKMTQR